MALTVLAYCRRVCNHAWFSATKTQIKQQERQLRSLRRKSDRKRAGRPNAGSKKADAAKAQWAQAGLAVEAARAGRKFAPIQERRTKSHTLAEQAQWTVLEHTTLSNATDGGNQCLWAIELYKQQQTPALFHRSLDGASYGFAQAVMDENSSVLSQTTHILAEKAQEQEIALRELEEFRWQNEEQKQDAIALDQLPSPAANGEKVAATGRKRCNGARCLEEERVQLEQSAQALRVMLAELKRPSRLDPVDTHRHTAHGRRV